MDYNIIRISTRYYKLIQRPNTKGELTEFRVPWSISAIREDYPTSWLEIVKNIPRYNTEVCIPDHLNYQRNIENCYNNYEPLSHIPIEGACDNTLQYLRHIFDGQIKQGLDYLKVIYEKPLKKLPILCLVSKERNTGKSTFLQWLKAIYESNASYLEDNSFTDTHNSDWVQKLLVCCDEVLFQTREQVDKLKRLSTSDTFNSRAMHKDKVEVEFFAKFIFCSNYETTFLPIDGDENRYWVIKIKTLLESDFFIELPAHVKLIDVLIKEIPAFLWYLKNSPFKFEPKDASSTRLWFEPKDYWTDQLEKVRAASKPSIEKEAATILYEAMSELDVKEISFTKKDLLTIVRSFGSRYDLNQVSNLIHNIWSLEEKNSSYYGVTVQKNDSFILTPKKGRFYTITKEFLKDKYSEWLHIIE